MSESLAINLGVNVGGTNSNLALNGSSIIVSNGTQMIQGEKGVSDMVLHGNDAGLPYYAKVDLYQDVTSVLPIEHGGTNQFATPSAGQLLIGNPAGGGFTLGTITAGENITVTNTNGAIEIASTAAAGFTTTEYNTPGTFTYDIPAGAKWLNLVMQGAGGAGGSGDNSATDKPGPGGGAGGMFRRVTIPIEDGVTTAEVVVGAGGIGVIGSALGGENGGAGGQTTFTINSKIIHCSGSGGGGRSSGSTAGAGGSSGGSQNALSASTNIAAGAGSAFPLAIHSFQIAIAGVNSSNGSTSGVNNIGVAGVSGGSVNQSSYILGGTGGCGGRGGAAGGAGGASAGAFWPARLAASGIDGGVDASGGGSGGSSGSAQGGIPGRRGTAGGDGSKGSGGGGGSTPFSGSNLPKGGNGGDGYLTVTPSMF